MITTSPDGTTAKNMRFPTVEVITSGGMVPTPGPSVHFSAHQVPPIGIEPIQASMEFTTSKAQQQVTRL